jgi:hypothetical protein
MIATLCLRAGHNLSKEEWARYLGPDTPWQPSCSNADTRLTSLTLVPGAR